MVRQLLKGIKGKFILSYYDYEFVRKIYKGFKTVMKDVPKYSVGNFKHGTKQHKPIGHKLLIMNYKQLRMPNLSEGDS